MSTFAENLRQLRGTSSQSEMARTVGMKQPQWARYESGVSTPSIEILTQICRAHAVSSDWLLGLDQKNNTAIASGRNSVALAGNNQSVIIGEASSCSKCPYKKKLKALEKLIAK